MASRDVTPSHPHYLPALDGLRFFAAIFVAIAHLLLSTYKVAPAPLAVTYLSTLAVMGMTLFFVLSGFVIHYNYHIDQKGWNAKRLRDFSMARFSRLYPLFLLVVLFDLYTAATQSSYQANYGRALDALPYYLSMTHAWIYGVSGNNSLIFQFAYLSSASWSISVEIFLYLIYIVLALWLVRIKRIFTLSMIGGAVYVIFLQYVFFSEHYAATLNDFGLQHFGHVADMSNGFQDSFVYWVTYFSPYPHIMQFILGCIAAQFILRLRNHPPKLSGATSGWLTALIIAACMGSHYWMYCHASEFQIKSQLYVQFYTPLVAWLVFLLARHRNPVQRIFSSALLSKGGDASYSIYLLHMLVIRHFAQPNVPSELGFNTFLFIKVILLFILIIGFARLVYLFIELPAKDMLRRRLSVAELPHYWFRTLWNEKKLLLLALILDWGIHYYDSALILKIPY